MSEVKFIKGGTAAIDQYAPADGQLLFDTENNAYYIDTIISGVLTRLALVKQPFVGTQEQWDALTDAQKAQYAGTTVIITNDFVHENADMEGATAGSAGEAGLVPAPAAGDQNKVLFGDGTWKSLAETQVTPTYGSVGSASEGVDVLLTEITSWDAGSTPTLGTDIDADEIDSWSAGTLPIFTYDSQSEAVTYTAGTLPSLSYTGKAIPNVTAVGSVPTLTKTDKTLPRIVLTPTTVVTDVTTS